MAAFFPQFSIFAYYFMIAPSYFFDVCKSYNFATNLEINLETIKCPIFQCTIKEISK